jgi:mono/diheme cytochrome c family protein
MKFLTCCTALYVPVISSACGADAEAGRRLAQTTCVACHIVERNQRNEVADAPPFAAIGRKFEFNFDSLVVTLMAPHAKMNFNLMRRDADDIASYIVTLK